MFDIIGTMVMWNMYNMVDTEFREQRIINPIKYDNVFKYLHMGYTGICIGTSLFTLYKYY
jgi:hypothetical protein